MTATAQVRRYKQRFWRCCVTIVVLEALAATFDARPVYVGLDPRFVPHALAGRIAVLLAAVVGLVGYYYLARLLIAWARLKRR